MDFTPLHHFLSMQKKEIKANSLIPQRTCFIFLKKLRYPEEVRRLEYDSVKTLWSLSEGVSVCVCVSLFDEARWVPLKFVVGTFE